MPRLALSLLLALLLPAPAPRRRAAEAPRADVSRASRRRSSSRWTTACSIAATVTLPVARRRRRRRPGRFPVVLGDDAVQPQRRVRLPRRRDCSRRAGSPARSPTSAAPAAAGATLEGNFFSPREARDGCRRRRVPRHAAVVDRQGRDGRRLLRRDHPVPGGRAAAAHLAAIAPRSRSATCTATAYTHGGIPNLIFDAQYIARPGRARRRRARTPTRRCSRRRSRPSSASPRRGRSPSTTSRARTTTRSTATARRSTAPTGSGPGARSSAAGATGCCAAGRRCTSASRGAAASRRGSSWTRARTRAAARRSRR